MQSRLIRLGYAIDPAEQGTYGPSTTSAVEAFQRFRGLAIDGIVGAYTWSVLTEAGFQLGDRTLQQRSPMLRGDDVADLQQRLSALGFDPGRVDGIFGQLTASALAEFQRNAGLPGNGVAGPATLSALARFGGRHTEGSLVTTVRERSSLEDGGGLPEGGRLGLATSEACAALGEALAAEAVKRGIEVVVLEGDDHAQAQAANAAAVDLALVIAEGPATRVLHYEGYNYASSTGSALADRLAGLLAATTPTIPERAGMSLPLLRETVMVAVVVELEPSVLEPSALGRLGRSLAACLA